MSKKSPNRGESAPRSGVPTGQNFEQFITSPNTQQQPGAYAPYGGYPQQVAPQPRQGMYYPQDPRMDPRVAAGMYPAAQQYGDGASRRRPDNQGGNPNRNRRRAEQERLAKRKRRITTSVGFAAVAALAVGGTWAYNKFIDNPDVAAQASTGIESEDINMGLIPLEKLGEESLAPGQCDQPDAVLMVAKVSGEYPLVPMLADANNATPVKVTEYLSEQKTQSTPHLVPFATESGYPEATLNELPLALSVCEPDGANAITEKDGELIINRSALSVYFEDPNRVFGRNIVRFAFQNDDAYTQAVKPEAGQFATLPNPSNNMFLGKGSDEVYNTSLDTLIASMAEPQQRNVILALMELDAIAQLDNVVDGHENISYPGGAGTLQEAIDKALVKRIIGDENVKLSFTGNYRTTMEVPKDDASKNPITVATPVKSISGSEKFKIKEIKLEFGSLAEPTIAEPAPAPTPEPTEAAPTGP